MNPLNSTFQVPSRIASFWRKGNPQGIPGENEAPTGLLTVLAVLLCAALLSLSAFGQTVLLPIPVPQFFGSNAQPLAGGKLYSCVAGLACPGNPQATFTDAGGLTQNTNPIILNAAGFPTNNSGAVVGVWVTPGIAYKFVLTNSAGVQQWASDSVMGLATTQTGTPQASTTVSFSATPTFTTVAQSQLFKITLTGNVTSSTLVMGGIAAPSEVSIQITQDNAGGHTFVWPGTMVGADTISTAANSVTTQNFTWDGTSAIAEGPARVSTSGAALFSNGITATTETLGNLNAVRWVDGVKFSTVQAAINDLPGTGGTVMLPCGSYAFPSTPKSNVEIYGVGNAMSNALANAMGVNPGGSFQAQACAKLTAGANLAISQLQNFNLHNVVIDFAASNSTLTLSSDSFFNWTDVLVDNCGGNGTQCVIFNTNAAGAGNNFAFNRFTRLRINAAPSAGTSGCLQLFGNAGNSTFVTDNHVNDLICEGTLSLGLDIEANSDTNYFYGYQGFSNTAGFIGLEFNGALPGADHDSNSNQVIGYSCAANCASPFIKFGQSAGNYIVAQGDPVAPTILGGTPRYTVIWTGATGTNAPTVFSGQATKYNDGVLLGALTVGGLPVAAAANTGEMIRVSDSTAVGAEGQTCVGGSTHAALAFSDGTVWKCF